MNVAPSPADTGTLLEFMSRLGQAYLASGEQTALVELFLRRIASAYGMLRSRVVTFPTAVLITLHDGAEERVTVGEGPTQTLRLDQIADVYTLGETAERGDVLPADGLERLNSIVRQPPRFGTHGLVVGHVILSVGLALVLMPTLTNLTTAAILGAIVGTVVALNRDLSVRWRRSTQGQIFTSPVIGADGQVYVLAPSIVRDHRGPQATRVIYTPKLHTFTAGGGLLYVQDLPVGPDGATGFTNSPLNIWRSNSAFSPT